ncbi:outer membrane beta-barrel protein [Terriglobus roseus]|nr:outer membrane beta-barrel protein [Terriglobus roseus]
MNYLCACVLIGFASSAIAGAQAVATASRSVSPSAFVMGSAVYTGLEANGSTSWGGGKNVGVTAGFDIGVYALGRYVLGIEARGRLPVDKGNIVSETNVMGGLRIAREPVEGGRFRPYVDGLFGRGQMTYQNGGFVYTNLLYTQTAGAVYGGGVGVEYDVSQHFSAKIDGQVEHWSTPVTTNGSVHSTVASVGVAYRFGAGEGPR